ncbi:MAG: GntR family transcriptional regulator [Chloroflexota bacterium]
MTSDARVSVAEANGASAALPALDAHPTMKDLVYRALRERIVFGDAPPGERLVEADLAERFGVSKTPVREALVALQAEGLVTFRRHRGAEVSKVSVEEYRDLIFARDALEIGSVDRIIDSITPAQLDEAEARLGEMERALRVGDYRRYRHAQRALHYLLLAAPGRPTVAELAVQLNDRLDRYGRLLLAGRPERMAGDLEFNRARVSLIREGNARGLIALVSERHARGADELAKLLGSGAPDASTGAERGSS